MKLLILKQLKIHSHFSTYLKGGAILLLFVLSSLIVACGAGANGNTTTVNLNGPVVTVTINMNYNHVSPTPTLAPYWCGAWAAQTTPSFNKGKNPVTVYGKFVVNHDGNPVGVDGSTAAATVFWGDGSQENLNATTGTDGTAVFTIPTTNRDADLDRVTLVTVTFTQAGVGTCTVDKDRSAFFTLTNPNNKNKNNNNGG